MQLQAQLVWLLLVACIYAKREEDVRRLVELRHIFFTISESLRSVY